LLWLKKDEIGVIAAYGELFESELGMSINVEETATNSNGILKAIHHCEEMVSFIDHNFKAISLLH